MVLACNAGCFSRNRLVLLLRSLQQHRVGKQFRVGATTSYRIWQAHHPLLHGQVVRPVSYHETHGMG